MTNQTDVPGGNADDSTARRSFKEAVERAQAAITESIEDDPDGFVPGTPEYDGITAMRDVFGFCAGPEADLIPSELLALLADFADGFARSDEAMHAEDGEDDALSVEIKRLDGVTVLVGPYAYDFQADCAAAYFRGCSSSTAGAEGATITVVPYDAGKEHRPGGNLPNEAGAIAELMRTPGADQDAGTGDFPDLYARLTALHGDEARRLWLLACNIIDSESDELAESV